VQAAEMGSLRRARSVALLDKARSYEIREAQIYGHFSE